MKAFSAILAVSLSFSAVGAHAQQYDDSSPQARAALNNEQAELARQQLEQNAASLQAYQSAMAARNAQIRHEQQAHDAAIAAYRADIQHYNETVRDHADGPS